MFPWMTSPFYLIGRQFDGEGTGSGSGTPPATTPPPEKELTPAEKRITQLVSEKKEADNRAAESERKLKEFQDAQTKAKSDAEAETLKKKGEYDTLMTKVNAERETEKAAVRTTIIKATKTMLAAKHGLMKPEYADLWGFKFEVDEATLTVKNFDLAEKDFTEKFQKENPMLFQAANGKPVPEERRVG